MRNILQALSALTWICLPVLAHAQTKYPDWSSNGPALIGAKNGIAPLDGNAEFAGRVSGSITNSNFSNTLHVATGVSIIAGGAKYAIGDIVYDDHGGISTVTSVDSNGGVTGLSTPSATLSDSDYSALRRHRSTTGSGYNLAFIYTTSPSSIKMPLTQYPYFSKFINTRGVKLDGTDSGASIKSVFSGLTDKDVYDLSSSTNSLDVSKSGFLGKKDYIIRDYKNSNNFYGDGSLLETIDQGITHRRYVEKNLDWAASDFFDYHYAYVGNTPPSNQHNIWVSSTLGKDHLGNTVDSRGNVTAFGSEMSSYSRGDARNFDTNGVFTNYRYGTDWQWANLAVMQEFAPDPFIAHNTQEWLGEWDWGGWGEDGGPNNNSRNSLMITGWQVGGGYNHNWSANSKYSTGDQIQVSINGVLCSVVATTNGTTGNTVPDWSARMNNSESKFSQMKLNSLETITDGTVVWRYNGTMRMVIDNAMVVSYQPDRAHSQDSDIPANSYNSRTAMQYHSLIKTDALYDTAIINLANAQWPLNSTAIFARVPKDFYLDLSATYNSTATNNTNLLGYDSSLSALTFKHQNNTLFAIGVDGTTTVKSLSSSVESHIANGPFTDPDLGVSRDAKFGNNGIAVSGGIKTDTISVTGNLRESSFTMNAVSYSTLPTNSSVGTHVYCSDCYSKLREDGDTQTGVLVFWNGSRWNDVLGLAIQH